MSEMLKQFKVARHASAPLVAIKTYDPRATMQAIHEQNQTVPLIMWNCVEGMRGRNDEGKKSLAKALGDDPVEETRDFLYALEVALKLPADPAAKKPTNPIVFLQNAHHYFDKPEFIQGVSNLRDPFKNSFRTLVILAPEFSLPIELQQDVLVLDEPLPTEQQLAEKVREVTKAYKIDASTIDLPRASNALRGLGLFASEQALAMTYTSSRELRIDMLTDRKIQMIQETAGLSVSEPKIGFKDLGGLDQLKLRSTRIINGKVSYKVIVWVDEIDKSMAGAAGSANGYNSTEHDQHGVLLFEMEQRRYTGLIGVGVPGAAKSAFAQAFAHEAGCLLVRMDLGAAKGNGLLGQAENAIRHMMKVIHAIAGDEGAFFIATSNDASVIKPELKRRFRKGIWMFDKPTRVEKKAIWDIKLAKYPGVDGAQRTENGGVVGVNDTMWTGAEIETCVQTAWEENVNLQTAGLDIVPVTVSGKAQFEHLRREANGKYNSVSYLGPYLVENQKDEEESTERMAALLPED